MDKEKAKEMHTIAQEQKNISKGLMPNGDAMDFSKVDPSSIIQYKDGLVASIDGVQHFFPDLGNPNLKDGQSVKLTDIETALSSDKTYTALSTQIETDKAELKTTAKEKVSLENEISNYANTHLR